jgi:hypothetical protein
MPRASPLDPIFKRKLRHGAIEPGAVVGAVTLTVTINQAVGQDDPAGDVPILFTVVFSRSVTGFATGDVTVTGTSGAVLGVVSGSGATYTVSVSDVTEVAGSVVVNIPAGVAAAADDATPNYASTSTDNSVFWTPGYDWLIINYVTAMWYEMEVVATTYTTWETIAEAIDADIAEQSTGLGGDYYYFAWYNESGEAPATYDDAVAAMGPMWYMLPGPVDTQTPDIPAGGTVTVTGGYRYHTFLDSEPFWAMDPAGVTVELFGIGGGASGGRAGSGSHLGGGGGAGAYVIDGSLTVAEGLELTVAGSTGQPASQQPGNDGATTTIVDVTGASLLYTLPGGSGGGVPLVSSGAGKSTGANGGGGGAFSTPISGAGGTGTFNGGNGGGGASSRAGGGAGANGNGTSGVAGGQKGVGGDGIEWPSGSGTRYGGGGGGAGDGGNGAAGGTGGGGGGANQSSSPANGTAGTANTGSGGGGSANTGNSGGGASGRVVIRYTFP